MTSNPSMPGMCLVTVDLRAPGRDYRALYRELHALPGAVRYQQSSWIVRWTGHSATLRDFLRGFIDCNDKLMVVRIADAAWLDNELSARLEANSYPVIAA